MRRGTRRDFVVAVVAFAAACSSPGLSDDGFISLGRNAELDGGSAGYGPATGGAFTTGGGPLGGDGGTGGSVISVGGTAGDANGGTSTRGQGGTSTSGQGGTTGADGGAADGGTAGDANGGTTGGMGGTTGGMGVATGGMGVATGGMGGTAGANGGTSGDGATCGSGALPTGDGGAPVFEDCEILLGSTGRVCLPEGDVLYCGQGVATLLEQCEPGTCATGCCHAESDPCPTSSAGLIDCAGDCADNTNCMFPQMLPVPLRSRSLHTVRVGADTAELQCGERTVHYAAMYLVYDIPLADQAARITVSPPWALSQLQCEPSTDQCVVARGGAISVVTDVDSPPPRNVFIETGGPELTCP